MRSLIARGLQELARLLARISKLICYAAAGLLRRRELESAIALEWNRYAESGWASEPRLHEWEEELYFSVAHPKDRVLLVGCGTGRDLIPLIERGILADGLDIAEQAVERCRANLAKRGLAARLHAGPVETAPFPPEYDAAIFTWFAYSYIPESAARVRTLQATARLVRPGGRIVLTYLRRGFDRSPLLAGLARFVARLSRSDWRPEPGDQIEMLWGRDGPTFHLEHTFLREDVERETAAAGLRVLEHEGDDHGRIVLTKPEG